MKDTNAERKLRINVVAGKEFQLKIVNISKTRYITNDFFYYVYSDAYKEAKKIILESNNKNKELQETTNNIIAFCGERGQGKSSAMLSFSKLLKNGNKNTVVESFSEFYRDFSNYEFKVLNRIDPTELESCHSILSVIISRIFHEFQEKSNESTTFSQEKNELINLFQLCYQDIDIIKNAKSFEKFNYGYEDDLEELSMLSDSANIKEHFSKLVNKFLDFVCNKNDHYLVIQVDDTDLNVSKAYEIAEDIRKYFMIPNVIILMAVNTKLLVSAIEQSFQKSFDLLMKNSVINTNQTHAMALRYINKLIPGSRRINLPEISRNCSPFDSSIELQYIDNDKKQSSYDDENDFVSYGDIQEKVLGLIHEKTGIIFVKRSEVLHPIISKNTRSLVNFLSILNDMTELSLNKDSCCINDMFDLSDENKRKENIKRIKARIENIEKLEEYFMFTWIEENVGVIARGTIEEWRNATFEDKNKFMIAFLNSTISTLYKTNAIASDEGINIVNIDDYDTESDIVSNKNTVRNVLKILRNYEKYYNNEATKNLTFAIQTIYSIAINKFFCNQILLENERKRNESSIYSDVSLIDFTGSVLQELFQSLIPKERNKSKTCFVSRLPANVLKEKTNYDFSSVMGLISLFGIWDYNELSTSSIDKMNDYMNYSFDVSLPIVKCAQGPSYFFDINKSNHSDLFNTRITCFQIIANVELILELEKIIQNKSHIFNLKRRVKSRRHKNIISQYINAYDTIIMYLESINYINTDGLSFAWITKQMEFNEKIFMKIYERRELAIDDYGLLLRYYSQLEPFKKTYTIELLKERLISTSKLFTSIKNSISVIDLSFENGEIENILKTIEGKEKLSEKKCSEHQASINKFIKSAKEKLSKYF